MIKIDFDKAKDIALQYREDAIQIEMKPYDQMAMNPSRIEESEGFKQLIREKYDDIKLNILDCCAKEDHDGLVSIVKTLKGGL